MINRSNWKDVNEFIDYLEAIRQVDKTTLRNRRGHLRHLLVWADDIRFTKAKQIEPTFPAYLNRYRMERNNSKLSPESYEDICGTARMFFAWARDVHPVIYKGVGLTWIKGIRAGRAYSTQSVIKTRVYWTLDDVKKVCSLVPCDNLELRDMAAIAFLFLSGMRAGAFLTLPISCVDLDNLRVKQLPELGVHTKNHKAAITAMYNIPILIDVIKRWDGIIRAKQNDWGYWYAPIKSDRNTILMNPKKVGEFRHKSLYNGFRSLCAKAGIEYKSPHKLRHGHAVHGIKNVNDMAGLKKISQNLMHGSIMITDSIYAELTSDDIGKTITAIGEGVIEKPDQKELLSKLMEFIKSNP